MSSLSTALVRRHSPYEQVIPLDKRSTQVTLTPRGVCCSAENVLRHPTLSTRHQLGVCLCQCLGQRSNQQGDSPSYQSSPTSLLCPLCWQTHCAVHRGGHRLTQFPQGQVTLPRGAALGVAGVHYDLGHTHNLEVFLIWCAKCLLAQHNLDLVHRSLGAVGVGAAGRGQDPLGGDEGAGTEWGVG